MEDLLILAVTQNGQQVSLHNVWTSWCHQLRNLKAVSLSWYFTRPRCRRPLWQKVFFAVAGLIICFHGTSKSKVAAHVEPIRIVTVTVVGEAGVGKSSILRRFRNANFKEEYCRTVGVERSQIIVEKFLTTDKSDKVLLRFLDTNDIFLELSQCTTMQDYVDAHHASFSNFVLVVYDVTNHPSFIEAKNWISVVNSMLSGIATLILVANKSDCEKQREVHKTAGEVLASLNGMKFLEVSAKENSNITSLFQIMTN
ncbi:hypothetical protein Btru_064791 [Bulinus truncatus]|nr:hypothetical protein Btru_064791 [Bulinus truncatus]